MRIVITNEVIERDKKHIRTKYDILRHRYCMLKPNPYKCLHKGKYYEEGASRNALCDV